MVLVIARDRSDSIWTQEFALVKHRAEHPPEVLFVEDGCQATAFLSLLSRVVDEPDQLRPCLEKSTEWIHQLRILVQHFTVKHGHGAEWQQPDHRSNLETRRVSIRKPEHVVEEPVFLVPHPNIVSGAHHRGRNPEVMFDELLTHLTVGGLLEREFSGDFEHVLTKQR